MRTWSVLGQQDNLERFSADLTDDAKMLTHCTPIFFMPSTASPPTGITTNGTVALIDTGRRKILVTCAHVWFEFLKFRENNDGAVLSVKFRCGRGPLTGIRDAALIDCDGDRMGSDPKC